MKGLSNIIGFLVVMGIFSFGAFAGLKIVKSQLDVLKTQQNLDKAVSEISKIRDAVFRLSVQSPGSGESVDVEDIKVVFDANTSTVYSEIPALSEIIPAGRKMLKHGIEIFGGSDARGYENSTHVILENSLVRVSIKKMSYVETSKLVDEMLLKPDRRMKGNFRIRVDGNPLSERGNGYVRLSTLGSGLPEAVAVARIEDSSSPYNYTIVFSLPAKSDYLKIFVRDVEKN